MLFIAIMILLSRRLAMQGQENSKSGKFAVIRGANVCVFLVRRYRLKLIKCFMNSCLPTVFSSCVKGLCDPYVTVELLPEVFFGNEVKKTEIIKNTLYPLFDEQFDL